MKVKVKVKVMTDADAWEKAERNALIAHREELVQAERQMVRIVWRAFIVTCIFTLSSAWLWMKLTGRT